MRIKILLVVTMMAGFIYAGTCEANAQTKKSRELEDRIGSLCDSIAILKEQIEALKQENEKYKSERCVAEEVVADSTTVTLPEAEPEEYTTEVSDSLLNIWYAHQLAKELNDEEYNLDSIVFESNVPDEVYIERIKKMNSFIQIPYNDIVRNYIIMYSEKMPKSMPHILGLCKHYMPLFEEIFDKYGLPVELKAMAIIESAMNPRAESRVGAKGMWQFMYQTAKMYDLHVDSFVDERMDPIKSCNAAAQYLLDSYNMFGDWNLAIASYNCGAGNVMKAIKRAGGSRKFWDIWPYLPKETRTYVPAFVGALFSIGRTASSFCGSESVPKTDLTSSVKKAIGATLNICGFVTLFSVFSGILDSMKLPDILKYTLLPFLEISNAARALSPQYIDSTASITLTAFAVSFSGFSAHMQVKSFISSREVSMKRYYLMKHCSGVISASLLFIITKLK